MSKGRIIVSVIGFGLGLFLVVNALNNIMNTYNESALAEKNWGYEYGRCVFNSGVSLENCNALYSKHKGFEMYEKYYGDGSWTVEADPIPN